MRVEPGESSPGWVDQAAAGPPTAFPVWGRPVHAMAQLPAHPVGWNAYDLLLARRLADASRTVRRVPANRTRFPAPRPTGRERFQVGESAGHQHR
jgi:hypothetical protein